MIISEFLRKLNDLKNTDKTSKINLTFNGIIIVILIGYLYCLFDGVIADNKALLSFVGLILLRTAIYYSIIMILLTILKNKFENIVHLYRVKLIGLYHLTAKMDYKVIVLNKENETREAFILSPYQAAIDITNQPLRIEGEIREEKSVVREKKRNLLEPLNS